MTRKIWILSALAVSAAATLPLTAQAQGPTACEGGSANINTVYFTPNSSNTDALKDQLTYVAKRLGGTGSAVVTGRIDAAERSVSGLDRARADAVIKKLVDQLGVKASQVTPAAGGPISSGEALTNRRVEICIKGAVYPPPS